MSSSSSGNEDFASDCDNYLSESPENSPLSSPKDDEILPYSIGLLKPHGENNGPQQHELLEVLYIVNCDPSSMVSIYFKSLYLFIYDFTHFVGIHFLYKQ